MFRFFAWAMGARILLTIIVATTLSGLVAYFAGDQITVAGIILACPAVGLAASVYLCRELYKRYLILNRRFEELRRVESLHAAGQLSFGLAHELRNPLAAIKGYLQLSGQRIGDNPALQRYLASAAAEIDRVAGMLEDFLKLSRVTISEFSRVDVEQVMREVLAFLEGETSRRRIRLYHCYGGALPPVRADPAQLKQVFFNLLLNAIAAVESGGSIWVGYSCLDQAVVIHIKDNGCGMDEEVLARLGEPFFTTKANGTGLGLAVSYRIIKEHGGSINVASRPGQGALFSVSLPVEGDIRAVTEVSG